MKIKGVENMNLKDVVEGKQFNYDTYCLLRKALTDLKLNNKESIETSKKLYKITKNERELELIKKLEIENENINKLLRF